MNLVLLVLLSIVAAWMAYKSFLKPPPPPPPPVISAPPKPLLTNEQLRKIVDATRDSDPNVRWESVKFLFASHVPNADAIIFSMLQRDSEAAVRRNIAAMLPDHGGAEASEALVKALQDTDANVRITVLQSLGKIGDFATAGAITEMLRDSDERVRLQALGTLNELKRKKDEEIRQEELRRQAAQRAAQQQGKR